MLSLVEQVCFVWRAQPLLAGFVRGLQDSKKLQALHCLLWCETSTEASASSSRYSVLYKCTARI